MHRFFVNNYDLKDKTALIEGSDVRHIKNVMRLKEKDRVKLFDGKGFECLAEIVRFEKNRVVLSIIEENIINRESPLNITVAQAYLKDNKMDTIIRHLNELGVKAWFPFFSERTVPKISEDKIKKKIARWEKIAIESLKQCERNIPIEIKKPVKFQELFEIEKDNDLKIVFWECEKTLCDTINKNKKIKKILLIIGPEGGFSKNEIELCKKNSFLSLSLGPRILKADTATISACSIVQHLFGDM